MAGDCRKCKDYRECTRNRDWFSYQEIRFCPFQVLWIILHEETLMDNWPPNPDGSSYIDPGIKTGLGSEAYYTKPAGILAEVNTRLAKAGVHGKLLRAEVLAGLDLSEESKSALMYVKGWRRKSMSYQRWLRNWRYKGKKLTKTTT